MALVGGEMECHGRNSQPGAAEGSSVSSSVGRMAWPGAAALGGRGKSLSSQRVSPLPLVAAECKASESISNRSGPWPDVGERGSKIAGWQ